LGKFVGIMSGLSLGTRVSNLKSAALTVLELLAFNSDDRPLRTHKQTHQHTHIERTHYLRHWLRSLGVDNNNRTPKSAMAMAKVPTLVAPTLGNGPAKILRQSNKSISSNNNDCRHGRRRAAGRHRGLSLKRASVAHRHGCCSYQSQTVDSSSTTACKIQRWLLSTYALTPSLPHTNVRGLAGLCSNNLLRMLLGIMLLL